MTDQPTLAERLAAAAAGLGGAPAVLTVSGPDGAVAEVEVSADELRRMAARTAADDPGSGFETAIGLDAPAVPAEEADPPVEEDIARWAARSGPPESAEAFAAHAADQWEEYEPDGTMTVGELLCGLLRQWRGEDGGFPATPAVGGGNR